MRDLRILVALGALSAVLAGCTRSSGECSPPAGGCPRSTFTTQMTSGTLAYKVGSATSATSVPVSQAAPSDSTCTALNLDGEVFKDEFVNTIGPTVRCETPTGYVYLALEKLGDPRAWPVGTRTLRGAEAGLVLEVADCPKDAPCFPCKAGVADASVTVVVEEAAGAAAPYPRMVTADYRRTYRIEVDTGPRSTANGVSTCSGVAVALSLHLEQTAARYVDNPHGECTPCE
jgi:hypothetical protein